MGDVDYFEFFSVGAATAEVHRKKLESGAIFTDGPAEATSYEE